MATYRALPDNLATFADATQKYLKRELGVTSFKIEEEIHADIDFRPTLRAVSPDKHLICAEVVEQLFTPEIENFVLSSRNHALPVKLYVAIPKGLITAYEPKVLKFARENGIAILEVSAPNHGSLITSPPVSLSLGGLRTFDLRQFPPKYREPIKQAIETFKGGNPVKGCGEVYDELEQLTRRIGAKCAAIPGGLTATPAFSWERASWASILDFMHARINNAAIGCPNLNKQLIHRAIGITEYRNEAGHKPSSLTKRIERDRELRTRFESAADELKRWIDASKPLKV